jgi:hypothetical protein
MTLALLLFAALAPLLPLCWGPGNHLEFAHRVLRRRRERLPREVVTLIEEERPAFLYGNLAADIINFKTIGGHYNHCHRWTIVEAMRELATTRTQEAFILGYLAHLAADTIAHNHFVPYHLARYARTRGLGHLYWEMNADRFVPEERWEVIGALKANKDLDQLDDLVHRTVPRKAFSMGTNKLIFNHVLLVSEREQWRRGMARIHPLSQLTLKKGFLDLFRDAAVERIFLALRPGGIEQLAHVDTNGHAAQKKALALRNKVVHRWSPGRMRQEESEEMAACFLEGMQCPPPLIAPDQLPHWHGSPPPRSARRRLLRPRARTPDGASGIG